MAASIDAYDPSAVAQGATKGPFLHAVPVCAGMATCVIDNTLRADIQWCMTPVADPVQWLCTCDCH